MITYKFATIVVNHEKRKEWYAEIGGEPRLGQAIDDTDALLTLIATLYAKIHTAEIGLRETGMVLRDADGTPTVRGILADALAKVEE